MTMTTLVMHGASQAIRHQGYGHETSCHSYHDRIDFTSLTSCQRRAIGNFLIDAIRKLYRLAFLYIQSNGCIWCLIGLSIIL
jgi:hypothetical protein